MLLRPLILTLETLAAHMADTTNIGQEISRRSAYGVSQWHQLFTDRQLNALATLSEPIVRR